VALRRLQAFVILMDDHEKIPSVYQPGNCWMSNMGSFSLSYPTDLDINMSANEQEFDLGGVY